jgi:Tfp pilus assembly protein PilF
MGPSASALYLLAIPSAAALALLCWDRWRSWGGRTALAWIAAAALYGALRGLAIRAVSGLALDTPFPYLMNRPGAALLGVSLQEIVGWAVAGTLALAVALRLASRAGTHAQAALAALALAAVCLAVESAAIASGWWTWTLALPGSGALRVPPVALLDWGFVAFDFILPWLACARPSSVATRALALALFPLHMLSHTWFRALPEPLPVGGYELVHVAIVAFVLWRAAAEPAAGPPASVAGWPAAGAAVLVVLGAATACLISAHPASAFGVVPLAGLAAAAFLRPVPAASGAPAPSGRRRAGLRIGVVAGALAVLVFVCAPRTRAQQRLRAGLQRGAARANAGDLAGAETALRDGLAARPRHAGARTLLALVLLRQGRVADARREIDEALAAEPTARDALLLGASLDLREGRRDRAAARADLGRRVYPDSAELAYLSAVAAGAAGPDRPAAAEAIALARRAGPASLLALATLADGFGDRATAAACRSR